MNNFKTLKLPKNPNYNLKNPDQFIKNQEKFYTSLKNRKNYFYFYQETFGKK